MEPSELYLNRELSWLAFNDRVVSEAANLSLPLYERLKFVCIAASNLDEFFMIRVAGLKEQLASGSAGTSDDGMPPGEQLRRISENTHKMVDRLYRLWNEQLVPGLEAVGTRLVSEAAMTPEQREFGQSHFLSTVFPALTPLAVDPAHPFPHLRNKSINLAVLLRPKEKDKKARKMKKKGFNGQPAPETDSLAVVQMPVVLGPLVALPATSPSDGKNVRAFVLLADLIKTHVGALFPGFAVRQTAMFRLTRNWDMDVDEDDSDDLLSTLQEELRRRDRGAAVRLEISSQASPEIEKILMEALTLSQADVYRCDGPLQISNMSALSEGDVRPELRAESMKPEMPAVLRDAESIFPVIAQRDILLHHPYESFDPIVRLIDEAANDPNVLAIKQTLYRTSGDSTIARALSRAAENGKQVAVLVEIKARLDEANNIAWARRLEEDGVHVVYGLVGLKTHCKVLLVVRREGNVVRRYVHLGTGNYNPTTARQYTDLSLLTSRTEIADDVSALFNMLTGYAEPPQWKKLAVAPLTLRKRIIELIERETARARKGEPARIIAKMNAVVEPAVIRALYEASQAGVDIDLLVRGICCLRAGVPGMSERIRVTSIVDRFLEHSRVFAFGAGDKADVYIASADWMPRNFHRRIEVLTPIEDPALKARLLDEVLGIALRDNVKARRLQPDGSYKLVETIGPEVRSQQVLADLARRANDPKSEPLIR
ncbi:MAG: polyphosphate kinase 1, partial [Polyangia bacterium]